RNHHSPARVCVVPASVVAASPAGTRIPAHVHGPGRLGAAGHRRPGDPVPLRGIGWLDGGLGAGTDRRPTGDRMGAMGTALPPTWAQTHSWPRNLSDADLVQMLSIL